MTANRRHPGGTPAGGRFDRVRRNEGEHLSCDPDEPRSVTDREPAEGLRNIHPEAGQALRLVDFPTDVASATAVMDAIPAECFLSGHEGGIRGCREARLDFEKFARRGDDTGAAVSAMEAWTSYRTRSGHRDDALDQMAEFRRFLR